MNLFAALRLARFDKPIGIVLLWVPTAWALWTANRGLPSLNLLLWFFLGTALMRAAGCVINDIADRGFDGHVRRTASRPLVSGQLQLEDALMLFVFLLLMALLVLLQLPSNCFYIALIALLIVGIYPFCKRFLHCPQLVLGLAFSMGIPMAYRASAVGFDKALATLLVINFLWVMAYDTEYAMVDRAYDEQLGIQSSALLFGRWVRPIIAALLFLSQLLWLPLSHWLNLNTYFYVCWGLAFLVLVQQQKWLAGDDEQDYFKAFLSNNSYGLLLWLGLILGMC